MITLAWLTCSLLATVMAIASSRPAVGKRLISSCVTTSSALALSAWFRPWVTPSTQGMPT